MRKYIPRSRRAYVKMYRWLRVTGGSYSREDFNPPLSDAQDCAILSYDYHDSEFSGWINRQRRRQFLLIRQARVFHEDYFRQ